MDIQVESLDWRLYERIVAALEAENIGLEMTVIPNARIIGIKSGVKRQVDVLVEARWEVDQSTRLIVDAKRRARKLDINDVETFEGMMKDCQATRGRMVCTNGWTPAAEARAYREIDLRLLTLEEADDSSLWSFESCLGSCASPSSRRRRKGMFLWDSQHSLPVEDLWLIVFTGKCDECHDFHVWCWDCGEHFAVPQEGSHECGCELLWASVMEEGQDGKDVAVHLVLPVDQRVLALDRRPLR